MIPLDTEILLDSPHRYLKLEDVGAVMVDAGSFGSDGAHTQQDDMIRPIDLGLANETGSGIRYNGTSAQSSINIARPIYPFALELIYSTQNPTVNGVVVALDSGQQEGCQLLHSFNIAAQFQANQYDQFNTRTMTYQPGDGSYDPSTSQHIVAKFINANSRELYVNGILAASNTQSISLGLSAWTLYVGYGSGIPTFLGDIGRIAYYTNYDLTPARIAAHYQTALVPRGRIAINVDDLEDLVA